MTRESYRLVETFLHFYTQHSIIPPYSILHCHHNNPYSLIRSCLCLLIHITLKNFMVYFSISNLYLHLLHHIYACHPSFLSLLSILLALLHIGCIQTAHFLLFRLAHTHNNLHLTSMQSFRSLLLLGILLSPSVLL